MGWSRLSWDKVHKLGPFDEGNELLGFTQGSYAPVNFSYKTLHHAVVMYV
jgi:hypothetical protein